MCDDETFCNVIKPTVFLILEYRTQGKSEKICTISTKPILYYLNLRLFTHHLSKTEDLVY